jgi:hypothetical protein
MGKRFRVKGLGFRINGFGLWILSLGSGRRFMVQS